MSYDDNVTEIVNRKK